jgi:hypothetical protein
MVSRFSIDNFNRLDKKEKLQVYIKTKFMCNCCDQFFDVRFNHLSKHYYNPKKYEYYSIVHNYHLKKKYGEFS